MAMRMEHVLGLGMRIAWVREVGTRSELNKSIRLSCWYGNPLVQSQELRVNCLLSISMFGIDQSWLGLALHDCNRFPAICFVSEGTSHWNSEPTGITDESQAEEAGTGEEIEWENIIRNISSSHRDIKVQKDVVLPSSSGCVTSSFAISLIQFSIPLSCFSSSSWSKSYQHWQRVQRTWTWAGLWWFWFWFWAQVSETKLFFLSINLSVFCVLLPLSLSSLTSTTLRPTHEQQGVLWSLIQSLLISKMQMQTHTAPESYQ